MTGVTLAAADVAGRFQQRAVTQGQGMVAGPTSLAFAAVEGVCSECQHQFCAVTLGTRNAVQQATVPAGGLYHRAS